jgi:16S rRNA (cytosine967-C5)-methyltransferase
VDSSVQRLAQLPWSGLPPLAPLLVPALDAVLEGGRAERVLDRLLRAHRDFSATQRQLAAESVFGVALWRRRLRAAQGDQAPALRLLAGLAALGSAHDAARSVDASVQLEANPPESLADRYSLPDWLAAALGAEVGDEAPALADALNRPGPIALRVNLAKLSRDALAQRLRSEGVETRPGSSAPTCLVVETRTPNLWGLDAWREGLFEVQDEGSQVLGHAVRAQPGETIIDLCAGAGGKTLLLAAAVGPQGRVHAYDIDVARLERLRQRVVRAGLLNVTIHARPLPPGLRADAVLVDAPCSETGALRRGPDLRWHLDPLTFPALEALQRALLERGAEHVERGGRLVYATCSLRREENEAVAAQAALPLRETLRTWPHREGTDAFFAACFGG